MFAISVYIHIELSFPTLKNIIRNSHQPPPTADHDSVDIRVWAVLFSLLQGKKIIVNVIPFFHAQICA